MFHGTLAKAKQLGSTPHPVSVTTRESQPKPLFATGILGGRSKLQPRKAEHQLMAGQDTWISSPKKIFHAKENHEVYRKSWEHGPNMDL